MDFYQDRETEGPLSVEGRELAGHGNSHRYSGKRRKKEARGEKAGRKRAPAFYREGNQISGKLNVPPDQEVKDWVPR